MRLEAKAAVMAVMAGAVAVSSVFGMAHVLRRAAERVSHRQPTVEEWFEPGTPTSPGMVARGRKLFVASCAHCHGVDARGDEGPDLHDVQVSDRYIANTVRKGIPHEMPAFGRKLTAEDVRALVAYVRSLE